MQPSRSTPDNDVRGLVVPRARTRPDRPQVRRLPVGLLPIAQAAVPRLSEEITARIRDEVAAFAGSRRRRLHRLVHEAVVVAVDTFVRLAAGDRAAYARVDEHFRGLGRGRALSGVSIEPVLAAIRLAPELVWEEVRPILSGGAVDGLVVVDLGSGLSSYLTYLEAQVRHGFAVGARGVPEVGHTLLVALRQEHPGREVAALADAAGWRLDEQAVVVSAQRHGAWQVSLALPGRALSLIDGDRILVATDADHVAAVRHALLRLGPGVKVAESWPIELRQLRHAYRWTCRLLELAHDGRVQPAGRVMTCAEHELPLLANADPPLVASLAPKLLSPLLAQKPTYRLDLAETLVLHLETDEPATVLAGRLGVHAQTVRRHIRRLEQLFDDRLTEPGSRTLLIFVLNAVLPQWRAEQVTKARRRRRR